MSNRTFATIHQKLNGTPYLSKLPSWARKDTQVFSARPPWDRGSVFVTEALVFGQRVSRVVHRWMDCKQRKLHDRQWALVMHNHQGGETPGNSEIWTQRLKGLWFCCLFACFFFCVCLELVALDLFCVFVVFLFFLNFVCLESEFCFVLFCLEFCFVLFGFLCAFLVCECHCFVFCCFDTGMCFEKPEKLPEVVWTEEFARKCGGFESEDILIYGLVSQFFLVLSVVGIGKSCKRCELMRPRLFREVMGIRHLILDEIGEWVKPFFINALWGITWIK